MIFSKIKLPCKNGECPYEYGKSDRDIEGMPFAKNRFDQRSCPHFGHICPKFMENLNLTVNDLNIRATIHCGAVAKDKIDKGEWKYSEMDDESEKNIKALLERFSDRLKEFPSSEYPQYY